MLNASPLHVIGAACLNSWMEQEITEMLSGASLGKALQIAMQRKGVVQQQVATEFGIRQPSVSEWLKHGRIAKRHIPHLVAYFSPHVGPEHWGLPAVWAASDELSREERDFVSVLRTLATDKRAALRGYADALKGPHADATDRAQVPRAADRRQLDQSLSNSGGLLKTNKQKRLTLAPFETDKKGSP